MLSFLRGKFGGTSIVVLLLLLLLLINCGSGFDGTSGDGDFKMTVEPLVVIVTGS